MAITESLRERASFVHDTAGSILTVRVRGEIDHHTAVSIRGGIDRLLYERRPHKLVLDLSEVSFMDSSGLGLIMGRLSLVRELGGELTVWNPGRETRSILRLAGMEKLLRIEYPKPPEGTSPPPRPAEHPKASSKKPRTNAARSTPSGTPSGASQKRAPADKRRGNLKGEGQI